MSHSWQCQCCLIISIVQCTGYSGCVLDVSHLSDAMPAVRPTPAARPRKPAVKQDSTGVSDATPAAAAGPATTSPSSQQGIASQFVSCVFSDKLIAVHTHTHTHTHTRLTALCPGLPGWACTRKEKPFWILLKQETVSGSGISWAICKSAPRSSQITTPVPHHSVFYRPDALPAAQPIVSKH